MATPELPEDPVGPAGFWSYAHRDNEQVKGRIVRLAVEISDAFSLLTGDDIHIFVDRAHLEWGNEWRARIDDALQEATFFIPIITPRYFRSTECRRELLKFSGHAASLGASELLLPILFVDVEGLEENSDDEAKSLIAATQYVDWRELRLADESSEAYQRAINNLARRLVEVARDYSARPTLTPEEIASAASDASELTEESPGIIDLMAEMESAIPQWLETITEFPRQIEEVGKLVADATPKLEAAGQSPKPFAQRILVFRTLAKDLQGPAARINTLGEQYATHLIGIDAGMRAFIAQVSSEGFDEESARDVSEFFDSVVGAAAASRSTVVQLDGLVASMDTPAKQSKDLRPVLSEIRTGLRAVLDGQTVLDEWERLIRDAREV